MTMRIAYLINEYPKISHSFVRREIEALERRDVEVEIFSIRPWSTALVDPADIAHAQRTTVLYARSSDLTQAMRTEASSNARALTATTAAGMRLSRSSEKSPAYWSAYIAEAAHLRQLLAERGIEHVHAHFGTNSAAVAMLCRMLGGPSYSFTVHGPEEFDRQCGLSLTDKISYSSFVVAISSYGKSQLLRLAPPSRRDDIHVVHCGLSNDYTSGSSPPISADPSLVTIGRLSEQKGHWILLEAARLLAKDGVDFSLRLVGDGELRDDVDTAIRELDLADRVCVTGWATEDEVREALITSRALVLPSFAEGLPVVIMEALALRRPVIGTYVAGIPELVVPGECGWLVPAGDPVRLAEAMLSALSVLTTELDRMGAVGAGRVEEMHNIDTEVGLLEQLFAQAIHAKEQQHVA